jgi:hypothetical protein
MRDSPAAQTLWPELGQPAAAREPCGFERQEQLAWFENSQSDRGDARTPRSNRDDSDQAADEQALAALLRLDSGKGLFG